MDVFKLQNGLLEDMQKILVGMNIFLLMQCNYILRLRFGIKVQFNFMSY